MWGRIAARVIGICALCGVAGCTTYSTQVTAFNYVIEGRQNALLPAAQPPTMERPAPPLTAKCWPNSVWVIPDGTRWTRNGDSDDLNIWCKSNGDWGISHTIVDESFSSCFANQYRDLVGFGHVQGNDPKSFVGYTNEWGGDIWHKHYHAATAMAVKSGNPAIKANFSNINACRVTMEEFPWYWFT